MEHINGFDFDGVVSLGITPGKRDIIITGRCYDEAEHVYKVLRDRGITNAVFFNPIAYRHRGDHTEEARKYSGNHKASTISRLALNDTEIVNFFEDDEIQAKIIKEVNPNVNVIMVVSDLVEK